MFSVNGKNITNDSLTFHVWVARHCCVAAAVREIWDKWFSAGRDMPPYQQAEEFESHHGVFFSMKPPRCIAGWDAAAFAFPLFILRVSSYAKMSWVTRWFPWTWTRPVVSFSQIAVSNGGGCTQHSGGGVFHILHNTFLFSEWMKYLVTATQFLTHTLKSSVGAVQEEEV